MTVVKEYKFTESVDSNTRLWIWIRCPPPGTYHPKGCQKIRVWSTGKVEVVGSTNCPFLLGSPTKAK